MHTSVSLSLAISWVAIAILTVLLFLRAVKKGQFLNRRKALLTAAIILFGWMTVQAVLAYQGIHSNFSSFPPRIILLGVGPAIITTILLLVIPKLRAQITKLDTESLTWLHFVRIPVEFGILALFIHKLVPVQMTFEGRNFDIISGATAPIVTWLYFKRKNISKNVLLAWNFICLALLFNIVITSILAAPFPFQKFAFAQPNIGVFYFPFIWLPTVIVPLVLLSHLVSIVQLLKKSPVKG
jgi:hypothetical protein